MLSPTHPGALDARFPNQCESPIHPGASQPFVDDKHKFYMIFITPSLIKISNFSWIILNWVYFQLFFFICIICIQKDEIGTEESFFGQISKTRENPKWRDVKASLLKKLGLPHHWVRVGCHTNYTQGMVTHTKVTCHDFIHL